MPKPQVRIRMYRPGLGDCFLLTFTSGDTKSHILIDCGIFVGTSNEKAHISQIAQHILTETGQRVNALVATHEHWDHIAGFNHARSTFDQLQTDEI
jgi:glyoxylase-like metal-dependent hydrolase (beta-lactamase superfamily II)